MPQFKPFRGIGLNHIHPLSRGLVGLWLANEGAGNKVHDLSGNGNIGTIYNALWTPGKFGSALNFDRVGDYIQIGTPVISSVPWTIIIWISFPISPSGDEYTIWDNSTVFATRQITGDVSGLVEDGKLHQISLSSIANSLYIDGVNSGETVAATTYKSTLLRYDPTGTMEISEGNDSQENMRFGAKTYDPLGDYWEGRISHIMIYNRILSAFENALLYREPFAMFKKARIPFFIPVAPPVSPNLTDRNNYNGYTAFIQQYIKHRINATTPWANPQGDLL